MTIPTIIAGEYTKILAIHLIINDIIKPIVIPLFIQIIIKDGETTYI